MKIVNKSNLKAKVSRPMIQCFASIDPIIEYADCNKQDFINDSNTIVFAINLDKTNKDRVIKLMYLTHYAKAGDFTIAKAEDKNWTHIIRICL